MMGVRVAGGLVRFTEAQVMDCLSMAPETFTLKSRNAEKDVRIGGDSKCLAPALWCIAGRYSGESSPQCHAG